MKYLKQLWNYLLVEPFLWVFYCLFRPARFKQEIEVESSSKRFILMLRLASVIFLFYMILYFLLSNHKNIVDAAMFSIEAARRIALSLVVGIVWGITTDIAIGITGSILLTLILSLCWRYGLISGLIVEVSIMLGILLSVKGSLMGNTVRHIIGGIYRAVFLGFINGLWKLITGSFTGCVIGLLAGFFIYRLEWIENWSIFFGDTKIEIKYIILGVLVGIACSIFNVEERDRGFVRSFIYGLLGGLLGGVLGSIAESIKVDIIVNKVLYLNAQNTFIPPVRSELAFLTAAGGGAALGILVGIFYGIKQGISINIKTNLGESLIWSTVWAAALGCIGWFLAQNVFPGFVGFVAFYFGYLLNYFRLSLYPLSALSMYLAYYKSKEKTSQVFISLHHSSLYWDEHCSLPLPYLKAILQIAAKQDVQQTLEEIIFIAEKRKRQIKIAQECLKEIICQELRQSKTLRDIANASQYFSELSPKVALVMNNQDINTFDIMNDASKAAFRYYNSLSWPTRRESLKAMIANLDEMGRGYFISRIAYTWRNIGQVELYRLEQEPQRADRINNPYVVGPVLELGTSLFVGRRDLAQQLEQALKRGSHRPTFFLNGERRMGKSSILRQLPRLLDDRTFLPIFFDLQAPAIRSSAAAFLGTVAGEIHKALGAKRVQVENLEMGYLQEVNWRNEAEVYLVFDEWLRKVEHVLEQEDQILLISFDEFESLFESSEKVEQDSHINLSLLLSWFRSTIQNRPRLALLFSGGKNIDEMSSERGINWGGYFVNVLTLKVSFLREIEARQLITQPIPDYPIERIFGDGVVDEIVHMTGRHPFLVQAVCSELVDNLNDENRDQAEIGDVKIAVDQVLKRWQATYFGDLWKRTDENQRICLDAIKRLGEGDLQKIIQQSGLDEKTVRRTLQTLLRRDLILLANGSYRMAAPIFAEWVERNQ